MSIDAYAPDPLSDTEAAEFIEDMATYAWHPVRIETDFHTACILVGQVQLALRHPQNTGASSRAARMALLAIIQSLSQTPAINRGLMAGFAGSMEVADEDAAGLRTGGDGDERDAGKRMPREDLGL